MAEEKRGRRVVITGMGAVTPIGTTVDEFWAGLRAGKSGVSELGGFPLEDLKILIAAQIKDFDHKARLKHFKRDRIISLADRYSWFAAVAADEAVRMSGFEMPIADPYRSACIIGSGAGGLVTFETAYRDLFILNKRATHPLTLLRIIGSSAAAHVGIEFGVKGPTFATCSACSTATHAIGIARDYIQNGLVDVAIAGASESVINYGTMKAWQALHVLSPEGCFPFSKRRNGTVLGEGAGILVMESLEHAQARGATILAELVGYGMASDSQDMVKPTVEGPSVAMQNALDNARLARPAFSISMPTVRRRWTTTSTRRGRSRTSLASMRPSLRSHRQNPCMGIRSARAAGSRRLRASRPCRRIGCRPRSGSMSQARAVISTTFPTSAATSMSPMPCRTRLPSVVLTQF